MDYCDGYFVENVYTNDKEIYSLKGVSDTVKNNWIKSPSQPWFKKYKKM